MTKEQLELKVKELTAALTQFETDQTALKNQLNQANVKVTELGENCGKGHCLRIGASESSSVYTAFLDSDLDIDPISIFSYGSIY